MPNNYDNWSRSPLCVYMYSIKQSRWSVSYSVPLSLWVAQLPAPHESEHDLKVWNDFWGVLFLYISVAPLHWWRKNWGKQKQCCWTLQSVKKNSNKQREKKIQSMQISHPQNHLCDLQRWFCGWETIQSAAVLWVKMPLWCQRSEENNQTPLNWEKSTRTLSGLFLSFISHFSHFLKFYRWLKFAFGFTLLIVSF